MAVGAADLPVPLASVAANNVIVHFTAKASLVSGTPFGKTDDIQGRIFNGFFSYDSSTTGTINNLNPDATDYKLAGSGFQVDFDGTIVSGSGAPIYRITNRTNTFLDQIQFADGTSSIPTSPFDGGVVNVNGVADATAGIYMSMSFDHATLSSSVLPNPFPFDTDDFEPTHLFTLKQGSDTIHLQIQTAHPEAEVTTFHVTQLSTSPSGFEAEFNADVDLSALNLYNLAVGGPGASDVTLVGSSVGPVKGSLVVDSGLQKVTFVKTGGPLAPDTYTLTLRSAANAFRDTSGNLLDGNANVAVGDDYVQVFSIAAPVARTIGLPDFARGPGQQVAVPASGGGIPLSLSDASGVTSLTVDLVYDPSLLHITSAGAAADLPAGATASVDTTTTPGVAKISFSSPAALSAGGKALVVLQADVPASATVRASQLLKLQNTSVNSGTISALSDNALQVVGLFGDANADQQYTGFDASRISRVVVGLDSGFSPFLKIDPAIIADINADGGLTGFDASRISRVAVGLPVPQIPPLATAILALFSAESTAAANALLAQSPTTGANGSAVTAKSVEKESLSVSPNTKNRGASLDEELTRSARREFVPKPDRPAAIDWVLSQQNIDGEGLLTDLTSMRLFSRGAAK